MNLNKLPAELLIILVASLLFIPFLGATHLFDWDEINFAESSREMIVTGNYGIPMINFQPFWEKPPLFFWLQVISMKMFGINEFAARFPNAVCGIITLVLFFRLGKKMVNERFGWIWVLVYAGSLLPHLYFKSGIIDPWFNLFIFLSIYYLARYSSEEKIYSTSAIVWSGLYAGLAVMTKGPVALIIIGLCYGVFAITNRFRHFMRVKHIFLFLLVTTAVGSIWFIALLLNGQQQIIYEFINYQVRLFRTEDAGHGGPFFYHFIVLLIGCFPAAAIALLAMQIKKQGNTAPPHFHKWMIILFWVVLLLFSIVKTKIVHYSSLCYFPLSFLAATGFYNLYRRKLLLPMWNKILQVFTGFLLAAVIIAAGSIDRLKPLLLKPGVIDDEFAKANLQADVHWTGFEILPGILLLAAVLFFAFANSRKIKRALLILFITSAIAFNILLVLIAPKVEPYSQGAAIEFYKSKVEENAIVEPIEFFSYAHLFYTKRPAHLGGPVTDSVLAMTTQPTIPVYFVSKIQDEERLAAERPEMQKMYTKNGFVFYRLKR
ncbi:ArnT family glycosyltransferase [Aridibaculum aurantiacum]|uniref:ArnT family glycosyltransferase n=1 Tax=Aridibaculum aurantiacum TaxID=2810307 RepID=UPI001A95E2D6|nr:glycosyltransferase family 39 protein [Aridibaculum aurantiacum]